MNNNQYKKSIKGIMQAKSINQNLNTVSESNISINQLKKIAKLVRIKLSDNEITEYMGSLDKVLNWMAIISTVDTENIPPMRYGIADTEVQTILRQDSVTEENIRQQVLPEKNTEYNYFVVPKAIEENH